MITKMEDNVVNHSGNFIRKKGINGLMLAICLCILLAACTPSSTESNISSENIESVESTDVSDISSDTSSIESTTSVSDTSSKDSTITNNSSKNAATATNSSKPITTTSSNTKEETYTVKPLTAEQKKLVQSLGLCVSEYHGWESMSEAVIKQHFKDYMSMGVKTVRQGLWWSELQSKISESSWLTAQEAKNTPRIKYLQYAKDVGMRVKGGLGTIGERPNWFVKAHPEAYMVDQYGNKSDHCKTISYWMEDATDYTAAATEKAILLLKELNLLDVIDLWGIDFGQAGEPHYPGSYGATGEAGVNVSGGVDSMWCYADNAQEDFRKEMKAKYSTIQAVNKAWGTNYSDFSKITVPKPNTVKGTQWRDVLTWYRDSKNRFVEKQIKAIKAVVDKHTGGKMQLYVYISGSDLRDSEFEDAVDDGSAPYKVRMMFDSRFMIQMAAKYGCWIQYTGANDTNECAYLRNYMDQNGYSGIPIFAENAGDDYPAKNPMGTVNNIISSRFYGFDFTHTRHMYESDYLTHTDVYDKFDAAMKKLLPYMETLFD